MAHCTHNTQLNITSIECFVPKKKFRKTRLIRLLHKHNSGHNKNNNGTVTLYPGKIDRYECVSWLGRRDFEMDIKQSNNSDHTAEVTYYHHLSKSDEYEGHVEVFVDGVNIGSRDCLCPLSRCFERNTKNNQQNMSVRLMAHQDLPSTKIRMINISVSSKRHQDNITLSYTKTNLTSNAATSNRSTPTAKNSKISSNDSATPSKTTITYSTKPWGKTLTSTKNAIKTGLAFSSTPSTVIKTNAATYSRKLIPVSNTGGSCSLFITNLNRCRFYTVCIRIKQNNNNNKNNNSNNNNNNNNKNSNNNNNDNSNNNNNNKNSNTNNSSSNTNNNIKNSNSKNDRMYKISCQQFQLPGCQSYQFGLLRDANSNQLTLLVVVFLGIVGLGLLVILAVIFLYVHYVVRKKDHSKSPNIYKALV